MSCCTTAYLHSAESGDDQWRDALFRHNRTIPRGSATSVCSISHRLKPARAVAVSSRCLSPIPIGGDIVWSDVHWSSDYDGSLDELEHEQNFREEKALRSRQQASVSTWLTKLKDQTFSGRVPQGGCVAEQREMT